MKEENALNKSINVNIDPKIVVAVILFVVIGVVFYMYGVAPKIEELNTLTTQISQAEQKLNVLLLAQDRLNSIENEINLYNNRLIVLKNILPPTPDEFLFSEEFVVLANKNGGKLQISVLVRAQVRVPIRMQRLNHLTFPSSRLNLGMSKNLFKR